MLKIYSIMFLILYLTVEVKNEENSPVLVKYMRYKRESLGPIGQDALPSRENDGHTDDIIYGFVGAKKHRSSSTKSNKKKGRKSFTHFRGEEEDEPSPEEMIKDVAELREDIDVLKSILRTEEDKLEELEDVVEHRGGGRYWPYSYYY